MKSQKSEEKKSFSRFTNNISRTRRRKQTDEALHLSEQRYQAFVQNSSEGIWCLELEMPIDIKASPEEQINCLYRDAYVIECNDTLARMLGFKHREQVIDMRLGNLMPRLSSGNVDLLQEFILSGYRIIERESRELSRDAQVMVFMGSLTGVVRDGALCRIWGAKRDITKEKQAETLQEALLVSLKEKTQEMESLLYVTSHDLRTPLVNIQGFSQRMEKACSDLIHILEGEPDPDCLQEKILAIAGKQIPVFLNYIATSINKMDRMITALLRISRLGRSELNPVMLDMNKLINEVIAELTTQTDQAGVVIRVSKLPRCRGDALEINQVFTNLIDNAIKYRHVDKPMVIRITGQLSRTEAVYCVADTGCGISPEHHEKIWEMFYRLNPRTQIAGEGVGLTLVRRIIQRHNGRMWLESRPAEGSRFFISLPAVGA